MAELLPLLLFALVCLVLMLGFPVAFTLGGVSLLFALLGWLTGTFDPAFLHAMPNRLYGIMTNQILIAVPLFVFMGVMLEKSRIAGRLLQNMGLLFGPLRGGLGLSVILVGMLMAASTGIIGATVVTMGADFPAHHAAQWLQPGAGQRYDLRHRYLGGRLFHPRPPSSFWAMSCPAPTNRLSCNRGFSALTAFRWPTCSSAP